ncbi:MAG: hypothetical protein MSC30_03525 [Gaiellaceae bacterium MAG52_C11]|nr:hypothetical protein [Candidatus Gaiellasilicea maunaloa]
MELSEIDDLLKRMVDQRIREDNVDGDVVLALAVRGSGINIGNALAMIAQNLGEIRDEMLNQRMGRG